ncbi:MAG TPA: PadR family transcriptional regulator [Actinocrinis sp.]|uniref:PadR family transcriptional regulator n=1 Tax=Actinocrinis sp. TaxID=1920516 RepID=UPI002D4853C0|nr:PadR family transcriptional regulator [Actinocrinis sp.]HZU56122.1 PadR family transcriptional regulator [Actinocrinis sp.]
MALRNALLATLLDGEASGYDLSKSFDASVANFWMATPQQLYKELEAMQAEGLVAARVVEQDRRPNKRVYRLTEAGLAALREFTAQPAKVTAIRDELLVKVQAVDVGDREAVLAAVAQRLDLARAKLARYDRMRARLLAGRTEEEYFDEVERVGPYLTLMRGRAFEKENIRWAQRALEVLEVREKRSGGEGRGYSVKGGAKLSGGGAAGGAGSVGPPPSL